MALSVGPRGGVLRPIAAANRDTIGGQGAVDRSSMTRARWGVGEHDPAPRDRGSPASTLDDVDGGVEEDWSTTCEGKGGQEGKAIEAGMTSGR